MCFRARLSSGHFFPLYLEFFRLLFYLLVQRKRRSLVALFGLARDSLTRWLMREIRDAGARADHLMHCRWRRYLQVGLIIDLDYALDLCDLFRR